jgi:hypothetical protein
MDRDPNPLTRALIRRPPDCAVLEFKGKVSSPIKKTGIERCQVEAKAHRPYPHEKHQAYMASVVELLVPSTSIVKKFNDAAISTNNVASSGRSSMRPDE